MGLMTSIHTPAIPELKHLDMHGLAMTDSGLSWVSQVG